MYAMPVPLLACALYALDVHSSVWASQQCRHRSLWWLHSNYVVGHLRSGQRSLLADEGLMPANHFSDLVAGSTLRRNHDAPNRLSIYVVAIPSCRGCGVVCP